MDKNKIKSFAVSARKKLIETVKLRLAEVGISENKISDKLAKSTNDKEYYGEGQESNALTGKQITWRKDIINELNERDYKKNPQTVYKDFVEEVAYTWFNRIISIRFMEVNNYLPTRTRVLSSDEKDKNEPDIINNALEIEDDLGGYSKSEKEIITEALINHAPEMMDKAYTILFIKQCDALNQILPGLFEPTKGYLELLFAPHYDRGVIQDLLHMIPESYFDVEKEGQVQIIGWLYQYYNSVPKEIAFKKSKYQTEDIPSVTQLFTPDWLVRYMVENSLGRYWIDIIHSQGDSRSEKETAIDFGWKYYMPSFNKKVINSDLEHMDITDIKFIDPAMGSGHILIYAFEVLMKIYEKQGYSKRNAANSIIENNIYGLDVDKRAYQLSYFSLLMKAREYDRRLFRKDHKVNLYDIPDFKYDINKIKHMIFTNDWDEDDKDNLTYILNLFKNGKDLGSIIKLQKNINIDNLKKLVNAESSDGQLDIFMSVRAKLNEILDVVKLLSDKYDISVTNPPYMGGGKMDKPLKAYAIKNYSDSKADLFSVFIERSIEYVKEYGYIGMITMHSWMFLSNFEKLRKKLQNYTLINMAHLGTRAFEEIGGEVVQTTTFILQKKKNENYIGSYERLVDYKSQDEKEEIYLEIVNGIDTKNLYHTDQTNFDKIPGSPIAYWINANLYKIFDSNNKLKDIGHSFQGMITGNNSYYLRRWAEVNHEKLELSLTQYNYSQNSNCWVPYNKGGSYRKWYGNDEYILRWENNGNDLTRSRNENSKYYFEEGITWSFISSSTFSCRYFPNGHLWDVSGSSYFTPQINLYKVLGLLNSKVSKYILDVLNPTMNYQVMNIIAIPFLNNNKDVDSIVQTNISLAKSDWDAFETSWNFRKSPLLNTNTTSFKQAYATWADQALSRFNHLKANEEELNRIFINLYGLQDELTAEEDDKEVSIRKADQVRDIKAFLSYFIGCTFGRYSLDQDGLAYAGGKWDITKYSIYVPNKDNIILLTDRAYFTDNRDIIVRLKEFLSATFTKDTVADNIDFIAQTLDPKKFDNGSNPDDIIRAYFINDFYKDHNKTYQKRAIYWEFNSGRNKGFKALMYLHRYTPDQLAMVRKYLHDLQPIMNNTIEFNTQLLTDKTTSKAKNQSNKLIATITKQLAELVKYDQVLDHISQKPIDLNLDDGVLINHEKLQQGEKILSKL